MDNDRMAGRPALGGVELRDRRGAAGVRAQAVDGFRGKGDEPPGAQDLRRAAYFFFYLSTCTRLE
jgi:hypothetical protein